MTFGEQTDCTNDNGVIVTLGFQIGDQSVAIVLPMGEPAGLSTEPQQTNNAVNAVLGWATVGTDLMSYLSPGCYLSYIQGDGMVDGYIPARYEFAPATHPGTGTGNPVPQQVSALITGYDDTGFSVAALRRCHTYLPGLPQAAFTAEILNPTLQYNLETLFNKLIFIGVSEDTNSTVWFRYLAAPYVVVSGKRTRPSGTNIRRIGAFDCRSYAATQKRRLLPRK